MLVTRLGALVGLGGATLSIAAGQVLNGLSPRLPRVLAADTSNRIGAGGTAGQSASAVRTISLGQNPIDLVLDPAPSRAAPNGRIFVSIQGPYDPYGGPAGIGIVRALDARDGRTMRDVRVGYAPGALALDEQTGHLFVVNRSERAVSMLDARGAAAPRAIIVPPGPRGIAVDSRAGRAILVGEGVTSAGYAPVGSGSASLLDTTSGRVLRSVVVEGQMAVVDQRRGRALILGAGLTILDINRARVSRTVSFTLAVQALALDETTGRLFAITQRDSVSVNGPTYDLTMLDGQDGRVLSSIASIAIGGNPAQVAVDESARRVLVFGSGAVGGLEVSVADAGAGRLLRRVTTSTVTLGSSLNTVLQALSPVVDARRGRVYVALTDPRSHSKAYVGVFDTRSGGLLHTIPVRGAYIQAMTVDARRGRLFVVSVARQLTTNGSSQNTQGYLSII